MEDYFYSFSLSFWFSSLDTSNKIILRECQWLSWLSSFFLFFGFRCQRVKKIEKMGGNFSEADRYVSISLLCNFSCVLAAYWWPNSSSWNLPQVPHHLKHWYSSEFNDYLFTEKPHFFIELVTSMVNCSFLTLRLVEFLFRGFCLNMFIVLLYLFSLIFSVVNLL